MEEPLVQGAVQTAPTYRPPWYESPLLLILLVGLGFIVFYLLKHLYDLRQENEALREARTIQQKENEALANKNNLILNEILSFKNPNNFAVFEEWARENYGYIKKDNKETFVYLQPERIKAIPDIPKLDALLKELNAQ